MANLKLVVPGLTRSNKPILIAESSRKPGFNANGSKANDMMFGDYSKNRIKNIRGMFEADDFINDLDTAPADTFFNTFEHMATTLFATGALQINIQQMIMRFKNRTGGHFSSPSLTSAVRSHSRTTKFLNQILSKLDSALKKNTGTKPPSSTSFL